MFELFLGTCKIYEIYVALRGRWGEARGQDEPPGAI